MESYEDKTEKNNLHQEALKQFRKNLSDVLTPDVSDKVLLKWLRAKNFNISRCEDLYRTHLMSLEALNIDQLEETWSVPEVIKDYAFHSSLGFAKDGTPIRYIAMGRGDLNGFLMSMDTYDIGKYCTYIIEQDLKTCKAQSKKLGKEINEVTYIVDMDKFSIMQTLHKGVAESGLDLFKLLQDQYPEVWKIALVINVPFYFQTIFNFFKPIFGATMLQKIHIASKDSAPNLLLKYIDADQLPEFLGGKMRDSNGDPMCSEFVKFGGIIPQQYYLRNRPLLMPTDPGVKEIWLQPRSCHNESVVVREANCIVRVEVRFEGGSIAGMLLYRKLGSDPENPDIPRADEHLDPSDKKYNVELFLPCLHMQCHTTPVDNYCIVPRPGIYIFRLDNSFNWLSHRRVFYRYRILPPDV